MRLLLFQMLMKYWAKVLKEYKIGIIGNEVEGQEGFRMKKSILTLVFGSALFLAACGGGDDGDKSSSKGETTQPDGEKLVQQTCTTCHGGNLQGASGPALEKIGAKYSEEEIKEIILNGNGGMPGGLLKGADVDAAAAYLAGLK